MQSVDRVARKTLKQTIVEHRLHGFLQLETRVIGAIGMEDHERDQFTASGSPAVLVKPRNCSRTFEYV